MNKKGASLKFRHSQSEGKLVPGPGNYETTNIKEKSSFNRSNKTIGRDSRFKEREKEYDIAPGPGN